MYCTRCGSQIEETNNFCPACGHETRRGTEARRPGDEGLRAPRRLYRLAYDKMLGGVCAGLARYFNIDVTLVRLLVVLGVVFSGGVGLLAYIVAWIVMPVDRGVTATRAAQTSPQATA
jgi:phage shock protein C